MELRNTKLHQNKSPISINDIDINIIVVSDKLLFGKQDFKYFIDYKDFEKKIDLYSYSIHKWFYVKEIRYIFRKI